MPKQPKQPKPRKDAKTSSMAAIRAEAEARDRKIRNALTGAAVAGILVIVAMTAIALQGKPRSATPSVDAGAPRPVAAYAPDSAYAYGLPYGTNPDAPVLELWEDFQCPACKALEEANGKGIRQLAEEGKVLLVYRVVNFLDLSLGNDSSTRAANAFACAFDAGKGPDYHDLVYANQPRFEGAGYTDQQLTGFAKAAGIQGEDLTTWQSCVTNRTYFDWAANGLAEFTEAKLTGTPTVLLNGEVVPTIDAADKAKLETIVAAVK